MAVDPKKAIKRNQDLIYRQALEKLRAERTLNKEEVQEVERREKAAPSREKKDHWPEAFDSLKAAAGSTGIPVSILQLGKEKGCAAFRSNRVYWREFIRWYFNGNDSVVVDWDAKNRELEFKDRLLDHEERSGKKADVEVVLGWVRGILLPIRMAWLGMAAQLASRVNPSDPPHAQAEIERWVEENMRRIADAERSKLKKK